MRRALATATILVLLFASACSSTTTPTTGSESGAPTTPDITAPEATSAPEPTTAPDTTSAPATTAPPAEGDTTTNSGAIWAIVLLGIVVLGIVVWLASRSGAKRGATQHTQEWEAAAYEAEHPPTTGAEYEEPPTAEE